MQPVRIFISSPGDVQLERQVARRVVHRLRGEFAGTAAIDAYFWEYEPMHAARDFQSQIPATSTFDIVICILWSRLGTPLGPEYRRPDGSSYASGTEYELEDAIHAYEANGTPDLLVYRNNTLPLIKPKPKEERELRCAQFDALEAFLDSWTREGDVFKAAVTTYTYIDQFEELLTEHLRKLVTARCPANRQMATERPPATWTLGSPFRGLEPFEFEHASVFRGRTRAVHDVIRLCRRQRVAHQTSTEDPAHDRASPIFVLVYAMSGIGKSSLVRAGVLPFLTAPGVIEGVSLWRRAILRPTSARGRRLEALAAALSAPDALPELLADGTSLTQLTQLLRDKPGSADLLVKGGLSQAAARLRAQDETKLRQWEAEFAAQGRTDDVERCRRQISELGQRDANMVVLLDQVEELFTASDASTEDDSVAFLTAIDALARCGRVVVLATIRSDFLAQATEIPMLAALSNEGGIYQLEAPSPAELAQIIREPAREAGLTFEQDPEAGLSVDDVLLEAVQGEPMALPLLEFTLDQLYQHRDVHGRLLLSAYRALDGVEGALAKRAEEEYSALGRDAQAAFGRVFGALVNLHDMRGAERPVRRRATFSRFDGRPGAVEFVERFVQARLLVVDREQDGERSVTVVHEALFSHWDRLKAWIEEHTEELRLVERLRNATVEWVKTGRTDAELLYRGARLAEATEWRARSEAQPNEQERAFLDASHAQAARAALAATAQAEEARRQRDAVIAAANEAVNQQRIATSRELAASSMAQLATNPELSLLLAIEAGVGSPTVEAATALRQSLLESRVRASLQGHAGVVNAAAFSPDGHRVVTASGDGTARVWQVATGQPLALLQGHTDVVNAAAFGPDGQRIVTASWDGTARVWDAATGQQLASVQGQPFLLNAATFSPDGQRLLTASRDGTAGIWSAATGEPLALLHGHTGSLSTAVFGADGQRVVTASDDLTARIWDAATGQQLALLQGHTGSVSTAVFSSDDRRVVTASDDQTARVWDAATGQQLALLQGHTKVVWRAIFSPDGQRVVTASQDRTARVWDAAAGQPLAVLQGHAGIVNAIGFSPDGQCLVTASDDHTARVWDTATAEPLALLQGHTGSVPTAAFSRDGQWLVTASFDGTARVWAVNRGTVLHGHTGQVLSAVFSRDGKRVVTASDDRTARIWDAATGRQLVLLQGHTKVVWRAVFSPDGQRVLTASDDQTARVWDAATGRQLVLLQGHTKVVWRAEFSQDGQRVLTASGDGTARVWDAATGQQLALLQGHTKVVWRAEFSPDGQRVVTASSDTTARVWDAATGQQLACLQGHTLFVSHAAFSPDGKRVVTASDDTTARLWDATTGQPLALLQGHTKALRAAAFSPDGKRVVTASDDKTALVWDAATGHTLAVLLGHTGSMRTAAFSPEGQWVLTASNDTTAQIFGCEATGSLLDLMALARTRVTRQLTPEERQQHLHEPPLWQER